MDQSVQEWSGWSRGGLLSPEVSHCSEADGQRLTGQGNHGESTDEICSRGGCDGSGTVGEQSWQPTHC